MKSVLIEIQYLPPVSYFAALYSYPEVIIESQEHYAKQSYRNRCFINTPTGRHMLVIPVVHQRHIPIMEVRIDHSQKWLDNHWRTIQSAYGKAPFFEYYAQDLHDILFKNHKYLFDLDLHLLSLCLKWLKWKKSIKQNKIYEKDPVSTVNDLRNVINAKNSTESMFSFKGIEYRQVFGHTFVADLSIIDLVFCTGPDAGEWIRKAALSGEQIDKK